MFATRKAAALAAAILLSFAIGGNAQAQEVGSIRVEVRTGGDDLRGNDDNAFIRIGFADPANPGRVQTIDEQFNRGGGRRNLRLKDYTTKSRRISLPPGVDLADLRFFRLFVTGFTGGFDGDNWNVDAIRVIARHSGGETVLINEFASPLVRFTGDNKDFTRGL